MQNSPYPEQIRDANNVTLDQILAVVAYLNTVNHFSKGNATNAHSVVVNAGQIAIDASLGNVHKCVLNNNAKLMNPTNLLSGQVINIILKEDSVGNRILTFDTKYKFPGGFVPSLTSTPNATDLLSCQYDADDDILLCTMNADYG